MLIQERKLRIAGYLITTGIFFFFFMMEMFFSWKDENLYVKVLLITVLHTLSIWEPVRLLILCLRKRFGGLHKVRRRLLLLACFALPYAVLIGFLRIFAEDRSNLWGVPTANWTAYSYTIGITLLFILLQIAVYEGIYFFSEWNRSTRESEELKRQNMQIQMDSLKVQIQPHFLFNTLNTLIGLIEVNSKKAILFTEDLAFVYRYLLDANASTMISLEEEIKFTNAYFSLLKTRYSNGLHLLNELKDASAYEVPPLSLQILIENAVKHNTISNAKPLFIHIHFNATRSRVLVRNNFQLRPGVPANGMGLLHLKKKFELLDMPHIIVQATDQHFTVSFPIKKCHAYESIDH